MIRKFTILILSLSLLVCSAEAKARKGKKRIRHKVPTQASLVLDANSGEILHYHKASTRVFPASTTKMMTLYLTFDALDSGKINMGTKLKVSKKASKMRPLKLGLKAGQTITVRDAILATHIKSANDAAVVLAENIAGSEEKFAIMMNKKARELGMYNTNFTNASGWHNPKQHSTALDLAMLGLALKNDHPRYSTILSKTSFTYKKRKINGHNSVLAYYKGANSGKTGFTSHAGCNLVTTAERNGKKLVAVVTGGASARRRDTSMIRLLDRHFGVTPRHNKALYASKPRTHSKVKTIKKVPAKKV